MWNRVSRPEGVARIQRRVMTIRSRTVFIILLSLCLSGCAAYPGSSAISTNKVDEAGSDAVISDGEYEVPLVLEGGTGRASIQTPVKVTVKDGEITAELIWSSDHYDYMIVDGTKYLPVDGDGAVKGHSVFNIPIGEMKDGIEVIGDTTAMSTPHEIEYMLRFDWSVITGDMLVSDKTDDSDEQTSGSKSAGSIVHLTDISAVRSESGTVIPQNIVGAGGKIIDFDDEVERKYAEMFSIVRSNDGYSFIHIEESGDFLIVPDDVDAGVLTTAAVDEGYGMADAGENLTEEKESVECDILCKPINNIYLVSSSAMDIFAAIDDELTDLSFSSLDRKDWRVDAAVKAMETGTLKYAGKYSTPDYELLLAGDCDLAIENTMVYHKPEVIEKLKALGIPVMVEVSSYEKHPLGRMEWIRLYGVITGKYDEAEKIFNAKLEEIGPILDSVSNDQDSKSRGTGSIPSVAFFYVTSNGAVNVRKSGDYISRMISMAGGKYIPEGEAGDEDNALSTVNMQMEAFYADARDADILIYNGTVGGSITGMDDLVGKDRLFEDFKAVKEGRVYTTDDNLYQRTMSIPDLITDINRIIKDDEVSDEWLIFLHKVE